jgi:CHAD domain-containing protein
LRSALGIFPGCLPPTKKENWIKEIQSITRALGSARDLDVQIDVVETFFKQLPDPGCKPGIRRLLLRLSQQRSQLQVGVFEGLDKLEASQVIAKMTKRFTALNDLHDSIYLYSPALYQLSFEVNTVLIDQLLSFDPLINNPNEIEALHAMRITAKKLRYSLETFPSLYENELKVPIAVMRKTQDRLGDIHDCDVWAGLLPRFIEEEAGRTEAFYGNAGQMKRLTPGMTFFMQDRQQKRDNEFTEFSGEWQDMKEHGHWQSLREMLQVPAIINQPRLDPPNTNAIEISTPPDA